MFLFRDIEKLNVLISRHTRSSLDSSQLYNIWDMILVTEVCTFVLATLSICGTPKQSIHLKELLRNLILFSAESVNIAVSALLYLVHNSLFFVAISNLTAPVFQVTNQMKLLITDLVSVLLSSRKYSCFRLTALFTLTFEISRVISRNFELKRPSTTTSMCYGESICEENHIVGFLAVSLKLLQRLCSSCL
jgi:UDP-sugar transporter A1/2/3